MNGILEVKKSLEEVMNEHNKIWKDIAFRCGKYYVPPGYNCFNIKDEDLYILAAGLIRKGLIK
jgi:hypothetical protein